MVRFAEEGIADLRFPSPGISLSLTLAPEVIEKPIVSQPGTISIKSSMRVSPIRVKASVNSIDFHVQSTVEHSEWLYNTVAAPYVKSVLRDKVTKALEEWMAGLEFTLPIPLPTTTS